MVGHVRAGLDLFGAHLETRLRPSRATRCAHKLNFAVCVCARARVRERALTQTHRSRSFLASATSLALPLLGTSGATCPPPPGPDRRSRKSSLIGEATSMQELAPAHRVCVCVCVYSLQTRR